MTGKAIIIIFSKKNLFPFFHLICGLSKPTLSKDKRVYCRDHKVDRDKGRKRFES
jgi:hypothetical protein